MEIKGSKDWEKLNTYQQEAVLDESPACVVCIQFFPVLTPFYLHICASVFL